MAFVQPRRAHFLDTVVNELEAGESVLGATFRQWLVSYPDDTLGAPAHRFLRFAAEARSDQDKEILSGAMDPLDSVPPLPGEEAIAPANFSFRRVYGLTPRDVADFLAGRNVSRELFVKVSGSVNATNELLQIFIDNMLRRARIESAAKSNKSEEK